MDAKGMKDLEQMAGEADAMIDEAGKAPPPGDDAGKDYGKDKDKKEPDADKVDVKPLMTGLRISEESARSIYESAQKLPQTKGMSPAELADALRGDMNLYMRLLRMRAEANDMAAMDADEMGEMGAPPAMATADTTAEM